MPKTRKAQISLEDTSFNKNFKPEGLGSLTVH